MKRDETRLDRGSGPRLSGYRTQRPPGRHSLEFTGKEPRS
jgi:hypothetical protein